MPPSFTRGIFTLPLEIDGHNPLREAKGWLSEESHAFLRRLMAVKPFAQRLERAIELKEELDSRDRSSPVEERSAKFKELEGIFDEKRIPKIVEECCKAQ